MSFVSAHTGNEIDLSVASGSTTTGVIKDFTTLSGSLGSTISGSKIFFILILNNSGLELNNSFSVVKTSTISCDLVSISSNGFLLISVKIGNDKNKNKTNKFLFKCNIALLYTC